MSAALLHIGKEKLARRSTKSKGKQNNKSRQWRRIDLHIHTPGSNDYQEEGVNYLDILRQAVMRGLDVIAITDHNSVAGFAAMKKKSSNYFGSKI